MHENARKKYTHEKQTQICLSKKSGGSGEPLPLNVVSIKFHGTVVANEVIKPHDIFSLPSLPGNSTQISLFVLCWRSFVLSRVLGRCRTHNCLPGSEYESGPGSIVPICKWTAARCHPQTARRRRRSKCPYARIVPQRSFAFDWLYDVVKEAGAAGGEAGQGGGVARGEESLPIWLRFIFGLALSCQLIFLCISFRSLRAANMQKCCKSR